MPLKFGFSDPAKQVTRLIQQEGEGVPIEMILREGVWNGFDANARYKFNNPDYDGDSYILVGVHPNHPNKLTITNIGGDYFSEDNAQKYFGTVANTCLENANVNKQYDNTKGRGAKISYFPHAPLGIRYYSKSDLDEGITFHARLFPEGFYGFEDFEDESIGITNFPFSDDWSEKLDNNVGTDMVLMGSTEEQNTWKQLHIAAGLGKSNEHSISGYNFVRYISNRLWGPPPCEVRVQIFNSDSDSENYGLKKGTAACVDLKTQMQKRKVNGSFTLPESELIPKGTKVYYAYLGTNDDKGTGIVSHMNRNGFVGFAYKGEVYYDKNAHVNEHRAELKNCGIFAKSSRWLIIFEIPSTEHFYSSGDRTFLKGLGKHAFFDALKENLPEDIKNWLEDQLDSEVSSKDLNKWLRKELGHLKKSVSNMSGTKLPGSSPSSNSKSGKKSGSRKPGKARQKSAYSKLQNAEVPNIIQFHDDESDLVMFDYHNYEIFLNTGHEVFKYREKKVLHEFDKITPTEIKNVIVQYTLKSSLYRIFEIQNIYEKISIQEKIKLWDPTILEAIWSVDTDSRIKQTLTKRQNSRSSYAA